MNFEKKKCLVIYLCVRHRNELRNQVLGHLLRWKSSSTHLLCVSKVCRLIHEGLYLSICETLFRIDL